MPRIILRFIIASIVMAIASPLSAGMIRSNLLEIQAADLRIARIGHRLTTANVKRCARTMPGTGLILHSLGQYGPAVRIEALAIHGFPAPVSVAVIVPQSPASIAGLLPGDGLVTINGRPVSNTSPGLLASRADSEKAERIIWSLPSDQPIRIGVIRAQGSVEFTLTPVPACRVRLELVTGNRVKAISNGETIQIGQVFAAELSDDELAVVLAHELAHTVLEHRNKLAAFETPKASKETKDKRTRLARQFEEDADLLSLYLLAAAGWDPSIAPRFLNGKGEKYDRGSRVHRPAKNRARLMEQEIDRMPKPFPAKIAA